MAGGHGRQVISADVTYLQALEARRRAFLASMARTAERMAVTAELSASVHDQIAERAPEAAEHANRDRLLAAAERDAAEAYRAGRTPSQATRQAIRASRAGGGENRQP